MCLLILAQAYHHHHHHRRRRRRHKQEHQHQHYNRHHYLLCSVLREVTCSIPHSVCVSVCGAVVHSFYALYCLIC